MSGSLTGAILSVLAVSDKPMTSYEVFELLPDIGRTIYPNQVKSQLKTLATRNKVMRIEVNEKHGRNIVKSRYFFKTYGGTNIAKSPESE